MLLLFFLCCVIFSHFDEEEGRRKERKWGMETLVSQQTNYSRVLVAS